jgi:hypothetical protein
VPLLTSSGPECLLECTASAGENIALLTQTQLTTPTTAKPSRQPRQGPRWQHRFNWPVQTDGPKAGRGSAEKIRFT